MKICFLGLDNLPVLSPEHREHYVGGESVQQTLLARALTARGHEVSMVTADYGQADGAVWDGIRVHKAYRPEAGLPVLRFVHPRWSGLWSALARADAQLYYTSCAGMQVALLAVFCARRGRRFVFRSASDSDCDRSKLLIRYARDRWLYAWGLRRADAILVQSAAQAASLAGHFGLASRVTGMLVEPASAERERDIDVLWVANIRRLKRPDRMLALAGELPEAAIHMVGGPLPGEEALYGEVRREAARRPNLVFHGRLSYHDASALYARARLLVNTSEVEGFPNSYLQAWINGVPVVSYLDPGGVIARNGLGATVGSPLGMHAEVRRLLGDRSALAAAGARCRAFMEREFAEDRILAPYLAAFEELLRSRIRTAGIAATSARRHV
ncbi:MAG: glycosyltransferase family 4 protein [Gammaproteobacteria bacterium]|nr:MAG: glycosyltransferase family 4 protein [Gammaproteobacteria bacterium]